MLLAFLAKHWFLFSSSFLMALAASLTEGIAVGTLSPLLRVLFNQEGLPPFLSDPRLVWLGNLVRKQILEVSPMLAVGKLALFMIVLYGLKSLFSYLHKAWAAGVQEGVTRDIRDALFRKITRVPLSELARLSSGDIMARFSSDSEQVKRALSDGVFIVLQEGLKGLVYLVVAALVSWKLLLFALVLVPVSIILISYVGRKLRKRSGRAAERMGELSRYLYEVLSGMKVVKISTQESAERTRFSKHNRAYFSSMMRLSWIANLGPPLTEFLTALVAAGMLLYSANLIFLEGSLSPDQFMVFLVAALSLMRPLKMLFQANAPIQQGLASMARLGKVFTVPEERTEGMEFPGIREGIEIRDLWFSYDPGIPVLKGINLFIRKGERLALVGPSGAGKSTLADLLAGFGEPEKGEILIDGIRLSEFSITSYRQKVSLVPQETFLFSGTVFQNIAYARPEADVASVIKAAEDAYAHDFIQEMPRGYDTELGERGARLSGGQRQRIALARALLKDPDLVILDEATSALDSESEEAVKLALEKVLSGRTSVIIAHRLSTVLSSDRILVLNEGKIVDVGTHHELLERCPLYRRLYRLQFELGARA
ncbi:MAG: ABC transporter ATP-binding protein [candidate division WOR-3 bacterium]